MLLVIRNKISVSRSITINAQEKNHVLWFNAGNILRIWCTVLSSEALVFLASDSEVSRRAWPTSENNVFSCIRSCVVSSIVRYSFKLFFRFNCCKFTPDSPEW
jgi:hypothetical protein